MAYDIPDKIQYKEKIVFGLTLKQLIYAVGFGLAAVFSFWLPLSGDARFVPPSVIALVGLGFIFLDLEKAVFDRAVYLFGVREGGAMDKKVQDFIGIRKIENDVVYLSDGQMRAILFVYPINYQNMDESRQKSVTANYREFLNQLSHPIQILVRTVNVDMGEYFAHHDDRVEKANNPQLSSLYRDFKLWEQTFLKENKVKERLYYLIVPYGPSDSLTEKGKDKFQILKEKIDARLQPNHRELAVAQDARYRKELSDRVTIIQQKLGESCITSRRLGTRALTSLFMSYFDGYAEVDQDYLSRVVVAKSFYERKEEENDGQKDKAEKGEKAKKSRRHRHQ